MLIFFMTNAERFREVVGETGVLWDIAEGLLLLA
jgi:hypothetical protein